MAQMDRGLQKLIALPLFRSDFCNVLEDLSFVTVERVLSLQVQSGSQFAAKAMQLAPELLALLPPVALGPALARIADCFDQLELFWILVTEARHMLLQQEARRQGFSGCARRDAAPDRVLRSSPLARSSGPVVALPKFVMPGPLRKSDAPVDAQSSMLLQRELTAKEKWIRRLEKLATVAGHWALINEDAGTAGVLTVDETALLRKISLAKGAFRTLAVHIRHYERFQQFTIDNKMALYPLSLEAVLKYCIWLFDKNCGPTVIPSCRAAISWVAKRLRIDVPDLADARLVALEEKCIAERAKELKEAIPFPLKLVGLLELFVMTLAHQFPVACLYVGWILCMIYASLRFDDAVHVHTDSLKFLGEILYGLCWQTKVERKRRGTKFAIASIGVVNVVELQESDPTALPWLATFWTLFQQLAPGSRDFWMFELDDIHNLGSTPVTYQRSLKVFKALVMFAVDNAPNAGLLPDIDELRAGVAGLTWHSCKVTMVDAAVHANEDSVAISIQAHHAGPGLVEKYTRNRSHIPLALVSRVLQKMREEWTPIFPPEPPAPGQAPEEVTFSEDEIAEDDVPMFYVRKSAVAPSLKKIMAQKFHVTAVGDRSHLACNAVQLASCEPAGSDLPDQDLLCKRCRQARPDLFQI